MKNDSAGADFHLVFVVGMLVDRISEAGVCIDSRALALKRRVTMTAEVFGCVGAQDRGWSVEKGRREGSRQIL